VFVAPVDDEDRATAALLTLLLVRDSHCHCVCVCVCVCVCLYANRNTIVKPWALLDLTVVLFEISRSINVVADEYVRSVEDYVLMCVIVTHDEL